MSKHEEERLEAMSPDTSISRLNRLCGRYPLEVANNPAIPMYLLAHGSFKRFRNRWKLIVEGCPDWLIERLPHDRRMLKSLRHEMGIDVRAREWMCQHHDPVMRSHLAEIPDLEPDLARRLVNDEIDFVRFSIACNSRLPRRLVQPLQSDPSVRVLELMGARRSSRAELWSMYDHARSLDLPSKERSFLYCSWIRNRHIDPLLIQAIWSEMGSSETSHEQSCLIRAIAQCSNTPPDILRFLSNLDGRPYDHELFLNAGLPWEIVYDCLGCTDTKEAWLSHPSIPPEVQWEECRRAGQTRLSAIAHNGKLDDRAARWILDNGEWFSCGLLLFNKSLQSEILWRLIEFVRQQPDTGFQRLSSLLSNPALTAEHLLHIWQDDHWSAFQSQMSWKMASHPAADANLLLHLYHDPRSVSRKLVVKHPAAPLCLQEEIARNGSFNQRQALLLREKHRGDHDFEVISSLDPSIRDLLLCDPHPRIRKIARTFDLLSAL
jgi:hypothetical protein